MVSYNCALDTDTALLFNPSRSECRFRALVSAAGDSQLAIGRSVENRAISAAGRTERFAVSRVNRGYDAAPGLRPDRETVRLSWELRVRSQPHGRQRRSGRRTVCASSAARPVV